ncbi:unnamed protein product [Miscanthus lutarioriparius]|uniref:Protein kinase domain-containing protein n=1 Tax=Miscanthus lutarioriparius TaxID=422564 RepID=A0A811MMU2_9POAL|nr:unnamed protein product [Miscanthus lutarioriparius]
MAANPGTQLLPGGLRIFSYKELSQATRGFSEFEKFGGSSFYRGFLLCHEHGLQVAIKRVFISSKTRVKILEVSLLSELKHRNIAQLIGWCHEADELLLVYEFSTKGSLRDHLYSSGSILTWPIRYKIILGVGDALLYLHRQWSSVVVHGNIKPSSVMLDSSFNARLGDFGLAGMTESTEYDSMVVLGTIGYISPELASGHMLRFTTETDVYSFGVLLLELASGRPPILRGEHQDRDRVNLVWWVWKLYGRGALLDAADPGLHGEFDADQMERALIVGLWCVHEDYRDRPSMNQAMTALRHLEDPPPQLELPSDIAAGQELTTTSDDESVQ